MKAARFMSTILWAVAVVAMAASTVQGQALLAKHDFSWWETWAIPAAIEAALAAALVGTQALARRQMRWGRGLILRILTVALSLVLNGTEPVQSGDWLAAGLHIAVPVLVYVLVEASAEYLRKVASVPAVEPEEDSSSSQLNGSDAEESAPAGDPLGPVVTATVRELADGGTKPTRDLVAEKLRAAGYAVSTERVTQVYRGVRGQSVPVLNGTGGDSNGLHASAAAG